MSRRVLVTRAEPGASDTAQRLRALGYDPIVEPLFTLEPIAADIPAFDALAFTSANGVRAFSRLHPPRRNVAVYVVGQRTADVAHEMGFTDIATANGDVAALATLIEARLAKGARLLHVGNEESRGDLAGTLQAKGAKADFRALYRAAPIARPGPQLATHLSGAAAFDALLIHSPRGAVILGGFLKAAPGHAPLAVAAISPAAASALARFARRTAIAANPDETALLAALEQVLAQG